MSMTAGLYSFLNVGSKAIQLRGVQVSQVRFRRIRSRNPPEPHFDRKAMLEVVKPIIPRKEFVCGNLTEIQRENEPHPWNVLKAKRLRGVLEDSSMILFYHKNSITPEKDFRIHNILFKKELYLQTNITNEVIRLAIQDTYLANAAPFAESKNAIVVSPHKNIAAAVKLSKKMPQYILLAGVIDRTFLSREQLLWLATVPSIQSLQAVTAGLLSTSAQQLYSILNQHQQRLSGLLAQHSKGASSPSSESSTTAATNDPAKSDSAATEAKSSDVDDTKK